MTLPHKTHEYAIDTVFIEDISMENETPRTKNELGEYTIPLHRIENRGTTRINVTIEFHLL